MSIRSLPVLQDQQEPRPTTSAPSRVLTPSKIRTFLGCPKRFEFQYVLKLPEPFVTSAMLFGKAMHAALERFHWSLCDNIVLLADNLAPTFANTFDEEAAKSRAIVFVEGETRFSLIAEARRLLDLYRMVALRLDVASVEQSFDIALTPEQDPLARSVLRGRIDLVTKEPGIVEFKTTRRLPRPSAQNFDDNLQLLAYAFAHHATFDVTPSVSLVYLVRGDRPEIVRYKATPTIEQFTYFRSLVADVRSRIDAGIFLPNPSKLCAYCPYQSPCNPPVKEPLAPPPRMH